jgi:hypothetical protein
VLTSNKHVRDWPEIFAGDEILTTAILDRLLHHVMIVHFDGKSYRLRALDALLSPAAESATTVAGGSGHLASLLQRGAQPPGLPHPGADAVAGIPGWRGGDESAAGGVTRR